MNKIINGILGLVAVFAFTGVTYAATTVIVTPDNQQGWSIGSTTSGGGVNYVEDTDAPLGSHILQLTTDSTNPSRAQYVHATNTLLKDVNELGYFSKQMAASSDGGNASYQLAIDVDGDGDVTTGFTTLVYEPYWQNEQSPDPAPVTVNTWQPWDVDEGVFWSSRNINIDNCVLTAGAGGAPFYTLDELQTNCPDAVVLGFGVNVGTYNPNYTIRVDAVNFNGTVYDFEEEAPDTQAPDVEITNPTDGATVSGSVEVRGTVTDDNPDHYYAVVLNSANQKVAGPGTVSEDQPLTDELLFVWDTTKVSDGVYTIRLEARDAAGNKDSESVDVVSVTVNNTPDNKNQCKNGGWKTFTNPSFRNQGQCVSYFTSSSKNKVTVKQSNNTTVSNNVTVTQNTGGNKANRNTNSQNVTVTSGNNSSIIEIVTRAARNIFTFR